MRYSPTTEALLSAIKGDVRDRVNRIVTSAEHSALTLESEDEVEEILHLALLRVEEAIAEAAHAMAREIQRERAC